MRSDANYLTEEEAEPRYDDSMSADPVKRGLEMNAKRARFSAVCLGAGAMLIAAGGVLANTVAGRVQFATDEVRIVSADGKSRRATKGEVLFEGDTVETGKLAVAQLRMADDAIVAMRAETRLAIDTFRWAGREDGSEKSVLSLAKGGFRTITGLIGRRNKQNYLVNTVTATIGIRGTDHEVYYIPPPPAGAAPGTPPGTYNKVNVGETYIRTPAGAVLELGPNQVGFAAARPDAVPVRLERVPDFMRGAPVPVASRGAAGAGAAAASASTQGGSGSAGSAGTSSGGAGTAVSSPAVQSPLSTGTVIVLPVLTTGGTALNGSTTTVSGQTNAPVGYAVVGADVYVPATSSWNGGAGGLIVDAAGLNSVVLDTATRFPVGVRDANGFTYSRETAPLVQSGSAVVDGVTVLWGVYAGGIVFDPNRGTSSVPTYLHFMGGAGVTTTLPTTGTATYSIVGGFTKPTDELGRIGGAVNAFRADVDFGTRMLTAYSVGLTDAGNRNWNASLVSAQPLSSFASGSSTLSVVGPGATAGNTSSKVAGYLIGPNAGGMISSYSLRAGTASVSGVVLGSK